MRQSYGPWALILGGSDGLGAAFADQLAGQGINLILVARSAEGIADTAARVKAAHAVDVRTLATDLTAPDALDSVRAVTDDVEVGFLLYIAGAAAGPALLIEQSEADALHLIRLNVIGQTLFARHYAQAMAARGRGGIILVGSGGCAAGSKKLAVYTASKAYTQILSEGLWAELAPMGVDVAALIIGRTRTPALERSEYGKDSAMATAEPADIAEYAMANLKEGPVIVPPDVAQGFDALRAMPRRKAVQIMTRALDDQTQ